MYRVQKMSSGVFAVKIDSVHLDSENIEIFVTEGTPIIIVDSLDDLEDFGIDPAEVEIV